MIKMPHIFLISIRATCPVHLNLRDFVSVVILGEVHNTLAYVRI
jgi:hypothetical protein